MNKNTLLGLLFIVIMMNAIISKEVFAHELVIGINIEKTLNLTSSKILEIFHDKGFLKENSVIYSGHIYIKKFTKDGFFSLKINSISSSTTDKLIFECADIRTGLTVLYEAYDLNANLKNNEFMKYINDTIVKIEQMEINNEPCNGIIVSIREDKIVSKKSRDIFIDLKRTLHNDDNILFSSYEMNKNIIELQDYLASKYSYTTNSILFKGQMCPIDILCNITEDFNSSLKIDMRSVSQKKKTESFLFDSISSIKLLISKIRNLQNQ